MCSTFAQYSLVDKSPTLTPLIDIIVKKLSQIPHLLSRRCAVFDIDRTVLTTTRPRHIIPEIYSLIKCLKDLGWGVVFITARRCRERENTRVYYNLNSPGSWYNANSTITQLRKLGFMTLVDYIYFGSSSFHCISAGKREAREHITTLPEDFRIYLLVGDMEWDVLDIDSCDDNDLQECTNSLQLSSNFNYLFKHNNRCKYLLKMKH